MSFVDKLLSGAGTTAGRVLGYVVAAAVLGAAGYLFYEAYTGPDERRKVGPETRVPETSPPEAPVLPRTTVARPDSTGEWIIEEVPADFDATLTISIPSDSSGEGRSVSLGLRESAPLLLPEAPGQPRLGVDAYLIGSTGAEVRLREQPQPIFRLALQAEGGLGASLRQAPLSATVGLTGARLFGVRLGGFLGSSPGKVGTGDPGSLMAGPYASIRLYGPLGVGVGKDLTSAGMTDLQGLSITVTTDIPLP